MPTPIDKSLYDKIKNEIIKAYPRNSAYRSGMIVQKYKDAFYKKYNNNNAYIGSKATSNLKRWMDEKWTNQRGQIGYQEKYDIYRPTIRINKNTPITFNELSKSQIQRAQKEKQQYGRVKRFGL